MDATATGHWRKKLEKELSAEELFALEEQVADLVKLPGWTRVTELIGEGHAAVLKSLTQGGTKPYADQSRAIGYLAGLEEAPNVVQAVADAASRRREKLQKVAVADQTARQEEPQ